MKSKRRRRPTTVTSAVALEGAGKSRFALTGPKPMTYISYDPNTSYVYEQMVKEGVIAADSVTMTQSSLPSGAFNDKDDVKELAEQRWEELLDVLRPLVNDEAEAASVVLDTATETYDLRQLKTFGKLDQISPEARRNMMGPVNNDYKSLIRALQDKGISVILLHRAQQKWEDKVVRSRGNVEDTRVMMTGPFDIERIGFKHTGFISSIEVLLKFDADRESPSLAGKFGMKIARNGHRPTTIGQTFWGRHKLEDGSRIAKPSFPFLMSVSFPGIPIETWL